MKWFLRTCCIKPVHRAVTQPLKHPRHLIFLFSLYFALLNAELYLGQSYFSSLSIVPPQNFTWFWTEDVGESLNLQIIIATTIFYTLFYIFAIAGILWCSYCMALYLLLRVLVKCGGGSGSGRRGQERLRHKYLRGNKTTSSCDPSDENFSSSGRENTSSLYSNSSGLFPLQQEQQLRQRELQQLPTSGSSSTATAAASNGMINYTDGKNENCSPLELQQTTTSSLSTITRLQQHLNKQIAALLHRANAQTLTKFFFPLFALLAVCAISVVARSSWELSNWLAEGDIEMKVLQYPVQIPVSNHNSPGTTTSSAYSSIAANAYSGATRSAGSNENQSNYVDTSRSSASNTNTYRTEQRTTIELYQQAGVLGEDGEENSSAGGERRVTISHALVSPHGIRKAYGSRYMPSSFFLPFAVYEGGGDGEQNFFLRLGMVLWKAIVEFLLPSLIHLVFPLVLFLKARLQWSQMQVLNFCDGTNKGSCLSAFSAVEDGSYSGRGDEGEEKLLNNQSATRVTARPGGEAAYDYTGDEDTIESGGGGGGHNPALSVREMRVMQSDLELNQVVAIDDRFLCRDNRQQEYHRGLEQASYFRGEDPSRANGRSLDINEDAGPRPTWRRYLQRLRAYAALARRSVSVLLAPFFRLTEIVVSRHGNRIRLGLLHATTILNDFDLQELMRENTATFCAMLNSNDFQLLEGRNFSKDSCAGAGPSGDERGNTNERALVNADSAPNSAGVGGLVPPHSAPNATPGRSASGLTLITDTDRSHGQSQPSTSSSATGAMYNQTAMARRSISSPTSPGRPRMENLHSPGLLGTSPDVEQSLQLLAPESASTSPSAARANGTRTLSNVVSGGASATATSATGGLEVLNNQADVAIDILLSTDDARRSNSAGAHTTPSGAAGVSDSSAMITLLSTPVGKFTVCKRKLKKILRALLLGYLFVGILLFIVGRVALYPLAFDRIHFVPRQTAFLLMNSPDYKWRTIARRYLGLPIVEPEQEQVGSATGASSSGGIVEEQSALRSSHDTMLASENSNGMNNDLAAYSCDRVVLRTGGSTGRPADLPTVEQALSPGASVSCKFSKATSRKSARAPPAAYFFFHGNGAGISHSFNDAFQVANRILLNEEPMQRGVHDRSSATRTSATPSSSVTTFLHTYPGYRANIGDTEHVMSPVHVQERAAALLAEGIMQTVDGAAGTNERRETHDPLSLPKIIVHGVSLGCMVLTGALNLLSDVIVSKITHVVLEACFDSSYNIFLRKTHFFTYPFAPFFFPARHGPESTIDNLARFVGQNAEKFQQLPQEQMKENMVSNLDAVELQGGGRTSSQESTQRRKMRIKIIEKELDEVVYADMSSDIAAAVTSVLTEKQISYNEPILLVQRHGSHNQLIVNLDDVPTTKVSYSYTYKIAFSRMIYSLATVLTFCFFGMTIHKTKFILFVVCFGNLSWNLHSYDTFEMHTVTTKTF
ncbi:unnamed protein product [Amoebophrya sp. A120]|nr:unnamed protein product [Amoebophrya sp. A120]|eukprot:GSA120T00022044001.1